MIDIRRVVHLWFSLLDDPRPRDLYADEPAPVQYVRDIWPDARPFPFDQP